MTYVYTYIHHIIPTIPPYFYGVICHHQPAGIFSTAPGFIGVLVPGSVTPVTCTPKCRTHGIECLSESVANWMRLLSYPLWGDGSECRSVFQPEPKGQEKEKGKVRAHFFLHHWHEPAT